MIPVCTDIYNSRVCIDTIAISTYITSIPIPSKCIYVYFKKCQKTHKSEVKLKYIYILQFFLLNWRRSFREIPESFCIRSVRLISILAYSKPHSLRTFIFNTCLHTPIKRPADFSSSLGSMKVSTFCRVSFVRVLVWYRFSVGLCRRLTKADPSL